MPHVIAGQIGLLLFNAGLSLAAVNAAVAATIAISQLAIGIGASLAINAAFRPRVPAMKPSDVQNELLIEVAPRRQSIGTVRVAGVRFLAATNSIEPDRLYIGWLINHGRVGSIVEHLVEDFVVTLDGGTGEITAPPRFADNGAGEVHTILSRLGLDTETAYSELDTRFGLDNMRGDGSATVLGMFDNHENAETQLETFPSGLPDYKQTHTGLAVFDPREPAHDRTDSTTWESSENPIVHRFHHAFVNPDGFGIPYDWVSDNLAEWIAAMDACDEAVTLADGGTEPRYRIAMSYLLTDDPVDVARRMDAACDARVWLGADGQMHVNVGVYETPTVVIERQHILGVNLEYGRDPLESVAGIKAQYLSPDHGYKEQDAEAWPDGATVAGLSEDRVLPLDLSQVPSMSQARRLMKRSMKRMEDGWHGTIITNLWGLKARDQRFIHVVLPDLIIDHDFEVLDYQDDSLQVTLEISQIDASIDDWTPAEEEGTAPAINPLAPEVELDEAGAGVSQFGTFSPLSRAFDGVTSHTAANCASDGDNDGYIGIEFLDERSRVTKAIVSGSNDQGYVDISNPTVTLRLYGKQGSAPASSSDGTLLGTVSFTDSNNQSAGRTIASDDWATRWDFIWVRVSHSGASSADSYVAEVRFFV